MKPYMFGLAVIAVSLTGCASAPTGPRWNASQASTKLDLGITEAEAINRIGWAPEKVAMTDCGPAHERWSCRQLFFGYLGNRLMVILEAYGGVWRVRGWSRIS